ncbi:MAG: hypothetical protein Q4F15_03425 [Bacillota bacterium]|nr:hypothetical protein [Bacillota bacterium]
MASKKVSVSEIESEDLVIEGTESFDAAPEGESQTFGEQLKSDEKADELSKLANSKPEEAPVEEAEAVEPEVVEAEAEEDDFADSVEPEPVPEPEPEPEPEPAPAPAPAPEPEPDHYDYDDPELAAIDTERASFLKLYKTRNRIKSIVSVGLTLLILVSWIVPTFVEALSSYTLYIALPTIGVVIVALFVYSTIFKKHSTAWIRHYFDEYYKHSYAYAFKDIPVTNFEGDIDKKIEDAAFTDSKMYKNIFKVGSRYAVSFTYEGADCFLIDCAAQIKGTKTLQTAFVGKSLRYPNKYEGSGLYIYFKGNDRAIPPNGISEYNKLEDNRRYIVYGEASEKKLINHELKQALAQIDTNNIFVDLAISIQPGMTHFEIGYEDTLMIIPMEKPFNPAPTQEMAKNLKQLLEIGAIINKE